MTWNLPKSVFATRTVSATCAGDLCLFPLPETRPGSSHAIMGWFRSHLVVAVSGGICIIH